MKANGNAHLPECTSSTHLVYKQKKCNSNRVMVTVTAEEVALPLGSLSNTVPRSLKM